MKCGKLDFFQFNVNMKVGLLVVNLLEALAKIILKFPFDFCSAVKNPINAKCQVLCCVSPLPFKVKNWILGLPGFLVFMLKSKSFVSLL